MLSQIEFPKSRTYRTGSDHEPFEFYLNCLFHSKQLDLLLGYFSSAAISVLSLGFAKFIYDGGKLRIVANQILSEEDRNAILLAKEADIEPPLDLTDIKALKNSLDEYGKHFFKCLAYLISINSIEIKIVKTKTKGIPHYKSGIFKDEFNKVSFQASCNFTAYGLLENAESLNCFVSTDGVSATHKITEDEEYFEQIFEEKAGHLEYISAENIEIAIKSEFGGARIDELLIEENELIKKKRFKFSDDKIAELLDGLDWEIEKLANEPKFPYPSGPRPYQIDAYVNWKNNNYNGVFAMATGTGKTITSLNCILKEYQLSQKYNFIVLVPSIALLKQWETEIRQFNFNRVIKIGGGHNWEQTLGTIASNKLWRKKENYALIATYGSFVTDRFQKYFNKIQDDITLIADEAHNIGASSIRKLLPGIHIAKKIGLSATPKRIYDPEGTEALDTFFKDKPPYCYQFDMGRALNEGFLTEYKYFPKLVELTKDETDEYVELSKKLLKYFDTETGEFNSDPMVEILLLRRKNLIHKAINKLSVFKRILTELSDQNKLQYIFTYVPEGYINTADGENEKLLDRYLRVGAGTIPGLKMNSYTSEDTDLEAILRGFSEGRINLLFAMKMLDEGVDVPRAEVGIFCSSTGNPRQFIQRRGRLLRKHADKAFATIYDMIVIPSQLLANQSLFNMEKNLVKKELQRVAYFASLSMNYYDTKDTLAAVCKKYELNLNEVISEL
ncbi:DEAD/DEAH box helicase family protein [Sphingobacterium thalpophilum]|uniref:DEAD/DEAH box helicase family protein n=1 Tax=Sphingobacterium thalpophilum TaxID=259 RepID=UPI0024A79C16|nr:DEAD/DEAH box helicase family protein [Sphingobacterium thalpophilum]